MKKFYFLLLSLTFSYVLQAAVTHVAPSENTKTVYEQLCKLNKQWLYQDVTMFPDLQQSVDFDNPQKLIQKHLELVENHLSTHTPNGLSAAQKEKRAEGLEILKHYYEAGKFPINTRHSYQLPYFIDDFNTACAVGHIMRESGSIDLAQIIAKNYNNAYIEDMPYETVKTWADATGFTVAELKWIQPTYSPPFTITETITEASCGNENGIIDLTVESDLPDNEFGFQYRWVTGNEISASAIGFDEDLIDVEAGIYTVRVTIISFTDFEVFPNTIIRTYIVNNDNQITIDETVTPQSCQNGQPNGAISLTLSMGIVPPVDLEWYTISDDLLQEGNTFIEGLEGTPLNDIIIGQAPQNNFTHYVKIIDANGCVNYKYFYVGVENEAPFFFSSGTNITQASCEADGSIEVNVFSEGESSYEWNDGVTSLHRNNLPAGVYTLEVTNEVGCSSSKTFVVDTDCPTTPYYTYWTYTTMYNGLCMYLPTNYNANTSTGDDTFSFSGSNNDSSVDFNIEIGPGTPFEPSTLTTPLPDTYGQDYEEQKIIYSGFDSTQVAGVLYYKIDPDNTFRNVSAKYFAANDNGYLEVLGLSFADEHFDEICQILGTINTCTETQTLICNGESAYIEAPIQTVDTDDCPTACDNCGVLSVEPSDNVTIDDNNGFTASPTETTLYTLTVSYGDGCPTQTTTHLVTVDGNCEANDCIVTNPFDLAWFQDLINEANSCEVQEIYQFEYEGASYFTTHPVNDFVDNCPVDLASVTYDCEGNVVCVNSAELNTCGGLFIGASPLELIWTTNCNFPVCAIGVLPIERYINANNEFTENGINSLGPLCLDPLHQFKENLLGINIVEHPTNGDLEVVGDSTLAYFPFVDYIGDDQYTYEVCYSYSNPIVQQCFGITEPEICFEQTIFIKVVDGECIDAALVQPYANCTLEYAPVCGCNNVTYGNACSAELSGVTNWTAGACDAVPTCNPDDLDWLQDLIATMPNCNAQAVYQFEYDGSTFFQIQPNFGSGINGTPCPTDLPVRYYDCEGNIICVASFSPTPTCDPEFTSAASEGVLIAPLPEPNICDYEDISEIEWLQTSFNSSCFGNVYNFELDGQGVIYVSTSSVGCIDVGGGLYTCDGDYICSLGGFTPLESQCSSQDIDISPYVTEDNLIGNLNTPPDCDIDDPLSLIWLQEIIAEADGCTIYQIIQLEINGQLFFKTQFSEECNTDFAVNTYYDCEGTIVCEMGENVISPFCNIPSEPAIEEVIWTYETLNSTCDVENPIEELEWLQALTENSNGCSVYQIIQFEYEDDTYIQVSPGNGDGIQCPTDMPVSYYTCDGEHLCSYSGISPFQTCDPNFAPTAASEGTIIWTYSPSNDCLADAGIVVTDLEFCNGGDFFPSVSIEVINTNPNEYGYVFVQDFGNEFVVLPDNQIDLFSIDCFYGVAYNPEDPPNFEAVTWEEFLQSEGCFSTTDCFYPNIQNSPEYHISTEPYCIGEGLFNVGVTVYGVNAYVIDNYLGEEVIAYDSEEVIITLSTEEPYYDIYPVALETGCVTDYIEIAESPDCSNFTNNSPCALENPIEELSWLQELVDEAIQDVTLCECDFEINYICYDGNGYITYGPSSTTICNDVETFVYDIEGNLICIDGGFTGGDCFDTFPDFFDANEYLGTFWNACNDTTTTSNCEFTSVEDLPWIEFYLQDACYDSIYLFNINDEQFIYIQATPSCFAADAANLLFTCDGELVCSDGGFTIINDQCVTQGYEFTGELMPSNIIWTQADITEYEYVEICGDEEFILDIGFLGDEVGPGLTQPATYGNDTLIFNGGDVIYSYNPDGFIGTDTVTITIGGFNIFTGQSEIYNITTYIITVNDCINNNCDDPACIEIAPVCGSDGILYDNACLAECNGATVIDCSENCPFQNIGRIIEDTTPCEEGLTIELLNFGFPTTTIPYPTADFAIGDVIKFAYTVPEQNPFICPETGDEVVSFDILCAELADCQDEWLLEQLTLIDIACPAEYDPVCGCDGNTYSNNCEAEINGITQYTMGACDIIIIDCICTDEYAPVCYEDTTYGNACEAECVGIFDYTIGECNDDILIVEPCSDLSNVDFGDCEALMGVGWINGGCFSISGCGETIIDGVDYSNALYPNMEMCITSCGPFPCACDDVYDPVCYEGTTFANPCEAACENIFNYTEGECNDNVIEAEPCTNLADVDFGPCDAIMGIGLINNECVYISGCLNPIVDGIDYTEAVFETMELCLEGCQSEITPCTCTDAENYVCGNDGNTYLNPCEAACAGVEIASFGSCIENATPDEPEDCDANAGELVANNDDLCEGENWSEPATIFNGTEDENYAYEYILTDQEGNIMETSSTGQMKMQFGDGSYFPAGDYCLYGVSYLATEGLDLSNGNIDEVTNEFGTSLEDGACMDISDCEHYTYWAKPVVTLEDISCNDNGTFSVELSFSSITWNNFEIYSDDFDEVFDVDEDEILTLTFNAANPTYNIEIFDGSDARCGVLYEIQTPEDCDVPTPPTPDDCDNDYVEACTPALTPIVLCPEFCLFDGSDSTIDPNYTITNIQSFWTECSISNIDGECFRYAPLPSFELFTDIRDSIKVIACNSAGLCDTVVYLMQVGNCGEEKLEETPITGETIFIEPNRPANEERLDNTEDIYHLSLYPNPAQDGHFNIKIQEASTAPQYINVFDVSGKIVYQTKVPANSTIDIIPIHLTNAAKGLYLVQWSSNNEQQTQRVVIE